MHKNVLFHLPVTATVSTAGSDTSMVIAKVGDSKVFQSTISMLNTELLPTSVRKIFESSRGTTFESLNEIDKTTLRVFTGKIFDLIDEMFVENFGEKLPKDLSINIEGLHHLLVQLSISRICVEHGDQNSRWMVENQYPIPGFCTEYEGEKLRVAKVIRVKGSLSNGTEVVSLGPVFHRPALSRRDSFSSPVTS